MEALICKQCGAPINRATLRCDYCGTALYNDSHVKIGLARPGVRTLHCSTYIPDELLAKDPKVAADLALRQIRDKISECLTPFIDIASERDILNRTNRLTATIRILDPEGWWE